jgi:hypothetical protein
MRRPTETISPTPLQQARTGAQTPCCHKLRREGVHGRQQCQSSKWDQRHQEQAVELIKVAGLHGAAHVRWHSVRASFRRFPRATAGCAVDTN